MIDCKLLVFVCEHCAYAGADLAGGLKLEYPANVRLVKVMCTGRVNAQMLLDAFVYGADGVMVLGCHPGDCHYKTGNYSAQRRILLLESMMDAFGIPAERLVLDWVSASEGRRFAELVNEAHQTLGRIGKFILPDSLVRQVGDGAVTES